MAAFEVEISPVGHRDGEGSAAEGGVDAATLIVEMLAAHADIAVKERPYLSVALFIERVAEVDVQLMAVFGGAAVEAVAAVHHLLVFADGRQLVDASGLAVETVEQIERRAAVAPVVCKLVGGEERAPAFAQGDVVAHCGVDAAAAVGMVIGEVVEGGGGLL